MTAEAEYRRRLEVYRARATRSAAADRRLGAAKLVLVFLFLLLAWLALISHLVAPAWLALPGGVLVALFLAHGRALAGLARAERTAAFYERGLARIEHRWSGTGATGERFRDPNHPYADDLDLFGVGSLFEMLSGARTPMGEERLARWLLAPAPPEQVRWRQQRVAAWREALDLREDIASLGDALKQKMDPARLAAWAQAPPRPIPPWARAGCAALAAVTVAAGVYGLATERFAWFVGLVLIQAALAFALRVRLAPALAGFGANREGLTIFAGVLARVPERSPAGVAELRRAARLADWIEASESLLGRILDITVLYGVQVGYAAESWRRRHGGQVGEWIEAVGEFEALLSLASYAFEHPADPFPELLEGAEPRFEAELAGHPLLPEAACVRNSVSLGPDSRLWLVSGSNMSGKSTLLRTVGVNAVLAQMGAPVRAQSLRLSPLAVGTRLRTADSLQAGRSGFYAELLRLRQIFDLTAGPLPVLYLFDELLEGTNSHDRVQGAAGLLRALLQRPALGMVTTHDLALAQLAAELGAGVQNVHFEDQIEGDEARFDHRLRPGVVTKSNAVALMRIVGLRV